MKKIKTSSKSIENHFAFKIEGELEKTKVKWLQTYKKRGELVLKISVYVCMYVCMYVCGCQRKLWFRLQAVILIGLT